MALTHQFKETVQKRIETDPEFRLSLLTEAINCLIQGEFPIGKAILRDYINATIGFKELGTLTHKSSKSLMRMLSDTGNPQAKNLLEIIAQLQKIEGIEFEVQIHQYFTVSGE
ncbi:transcriptional regulator [Crocosphaera sp. UHCC 0190]|uniref:helix-turn-helix domain-containing transcriptional regulator n=1 Tax=Crocosphaera sp. UHCC 0190 TaxID=3110246 RepID=UPI002B2185E6|nr:transcriptional regulator [Crocosphaera sp. UHCC 0190]MEA5509449.1 transcriptional regulator [Crocosphaera sp. UHCC 0190]